LAKYGGYYFDLKSGFSVKLPSFDSHHAVLINEKPGTNRLYQQLIANWFLAGPPGEFFEKLHHSLFLNTQTTSQNKNENFSDFVKRTTGPVAVTEFVRSSEEKQSWVLDVLDHGGGEEGLYYQCRRSWVRTMIHPHYSRAY